MGLINIVGDTFYLRGGTNTGVYVFEDKSVMIIDAGRSGLKVNKIIRELKENQFKLKYIVNTHEHDDHTGANYDLVNNYEDVELMMSSESKLYVDNPELFSKYILGGKSNNIMDGKSKSKYKGKVKVNTVLDEGIKKIQNKEFKVVKLSGHTQGSIGIVTPDKIFFVGDSLIGSKLLAKYDFLFLYDIDSQLKTLDKIEQVEFDKIIIGHGEQILDKQEAISLIEKNRNAIYKYIKQTIDILDKPSSIEAILKTLIINNDLNYNYREYHYLKTSLISLISYLIDLEKIEHIFKDGELLYYNTQKY